MEQRREVLHGLWSLNMKRYFLLLSKFFSYAVKAELEFRLSSVSLILFSYVWIYMTYVLLNITFAQAGKVAGWSREEALLLVLIYYVTSTVIRSYVNPSLMDFVEKIRKGELDFVLTKPVDTQFLLSLQKMNVIISLRGLVMFGVVIYYVHRLQLGVGPIEIGQAVLLATVGIIGIYSFFFIIATLAIWLENIWNLEEIFYEAFEVSKQPLDIYPKVIRATLLYVFPIIGISSLPALALLHRLDPVLGVSFVVSCLILFIVSRAFFYFAIRRYASASS